MWVCMYVYMWVHVYGHGCVHVSVCCGVLDRLIICSVPSVAMVLRQPPCHAATLVMTCVRCTV